MKKILSLIIGCVVFSGCSLSQYDRVQIIEKAYTNCVVKNTSVYAQYIVKMQDGSIYEFIINSEGFITTKQLLFEGNSKQ
jgi:uncharacterized protein YxeA